MACKQINSFLMLIPVLQNHPYFTFVVVYIHLAKKYVVITVYDLSVFAIFYCPIT